MNNRQGFTLIELLVVIGIIGILSALVILAINPAEMQRKGRDATRMSDLTNLRKAIELALANGTVSLRGSTTVYFSADSSATRDTDTSANYIGLQVDKFLPILPDDPMHIPLDSAQVTVAGSALPVTKDNMRYFFASDGNYFELNTYLESADNSSKVSGDGGDSAVRYEVGTSQGLSLIVGP